MRRRRSTTRKHVARILGSLNHWRAPRPFSLLKSTSLYWRQRLIIYSIFSPLFHLTTQVSGSPSGRCADLQGHVLITAGGHLQGLRLTMGSNYLPRGCQHPITRQALSTIGRTSRGTTSLEPLSHQPSPASPTIYTTLSAYVPL
jgi:hypothetical protein